MSGDVNYWKLKYEHLYSQYERTLKRNEQLEERMLNVVEKVEQDKLTLSEEIDDLASRLTTATNKIIVLENDCARYKQDCILAVHLLQCAPSNYISTNMPASTAVTDNHSLPMGVNSTPCRLPSTISTFPPTGIYFDDEPDDPAQEHDDIQISLQKSSLGSHSPSGTFTRDFVEKIRTDIEYSVTTMHQCKKCGTSIPSLSREVQTDDMETPLPVVFMGEHRLRSMSDASDITVI